MQLTQHISKAAWSSADKVLYLSLGLIFFIPQKVIGEASWGIFATSQAILTIMYMLADGFALQVMVNFGVVEERRPEATSAALILYVLFLAAFTGLVWLLRVDIALITGKPDLIPVLTLFPILALSFFFRNFTLKTAQLLIDTRGTFVVDAAWALATITLLLHGWITGWLVDEIDMVYVAAGAAGFSSIVGLLLYRNSIRFARRFRPGRFVEMIRFGLAQFGSATTMGFLAQGDILLLTTFVSDAAVVGNYDVAKKFFRGFEGIRDAGALFVYPAVARLSAEHRFEERRVLVEKMMAFVTFVIVPIVLLIWFGPIEQLFALIYKENYRLAPDLFRLMALGALAIPLSMNSYVLLGMSEVRKLFLVSGSAAVVFLILSVSLVPGMGGEGQAIALVGSFWTLGLLSTWFVAKKAGVSFGGILSRWRDPLGFIASLPGMIKEMLSRRDQKNLDKRTEQEERRESGE